jgi:uncharacterized membrane protein HdeD (DUF308 family)
MNDISHKDYNAAALQQLQRNWMWYLLFGIALVILGALAVVFSYTSTIFSVMYIGGFLVVTGIIEAVQSFKLRLWSRFFLHAILGILYTVAGVFLLMNPAFNAINLTLLLAIFFVISGIFKIVFGLSSKVPHQGWVIFNGVMTILLGLLLWQQWPLSGYWAIGLFVGIDMLFTGWAWIALAMTAKSMNEKNG